MNIFREMGVREGKDRVNEEVIYNIARAYSILETTISRVLSPFGLSPGKFNIMLMVRHAGGEKGIAQNEISRLVLVTTSNMTRMIDKLEKDRYVQRLPQKMDRRVNLIKITKKGSDLLDKVWPHYIKEVNRITGSCFSGADKKAIIGLLEKLKAN